MQAMQADFSPSQPVRPVQTRFLAQFGPWAMVTGASSGIGEAFAMGLAKRGCHVVLHGRREDALHALARRIAETHGTQTRVIPADLTDRGATKELLSMTHEIDIGLFVASAGFGSSGPFVDADPEEEIAMVNVNCGAVIEMSHHFSRRMLERGGGGIVLLSSLVAYQGTPWSATYAATKAFVQSFAEALRMELAGTGVRVIACTPGPVRTPFAERARMTMGLAENPEAIAEETLRRMGRRSTVRPGFVSKFLIGSLSLLPRWVRVRVMHKIMGGMAHTTSRAVS